jgi:hypothetical protein
MRKALTVSSALSLFLLLPLISHPTPRPMTSPFFQFQQNQQDQQYDQGDQGYQQYVPYSPEQLDNLLAPIALYPDPLLAQVLPAATFTDEIDEAARYVRDYGDNGVDDQPWDISVRSVAHYPQVVYMMDEKLDWTTAVGQAYVNQSTDVMESIQRLRNLAYQQGNLVSNPQWQIVDQDGYIQVWPASPEYIYVPTYDPSIIYYQRCYYGDRFSFGFAFSSGFRIGIWLNRDTDWRNHRIYYTGWRDNEEWERRSRPYVQINNTRVRNVYINNRVTNVTVNRTVVNRVVNVNNINNYNSVHRNVNFNNVARNRPANNPQINNRVINSNINTGDPRLNQFRGHQNAPPPQPGRPQENFRPTPQQQARPEAQRPAMPGRPQPARQFPPEQRPSEQTRTQVQPRQVQPPPQPRPQSQPQARPQQQFRPAPTAQPGAFGRSQTTFNPRAAQQRGAQSRQQMSRPVQRAPAPRPAPSRPHGHGGAR